MTDLAALRGFRASRRDARNCAGKWEEVSPLRWPPHQWKISGPFQDPGETNAAIAVMAGYTFKDLFTPKLLAKECCGK
jgi:hypothetical protein